MTDPRRMHAQEQREAHAAAIARCVLIYWRVLRSGGMPAACAQSMAEMYNHSLVWPDDRGAAWES